MVFDVGEPSQWNGPPKTFPRCGSWPNSEYDTDYVSSSNMAPISILATFLSTLCWLFIN